jgi:methylenetetrahydrofolate dehydrogenase (NADP+)/methenyltetrahydrofolate cyclohydrolase
LSAKILDGRAIAAQLWSEIEPEAVSLRQAGLVPYLAVLSVGDDPAAVSYSRQISRAFSAHGLAAETTTLPRDSHQSAVASSLARLASNSDVHGILLQLPLPAALQPEPLLESIPLSKDVEGMHPYHAGLLAMERPTFIPSTPLAGMEILRRSGVELSGRLAVVVGRSSVVGRPIAALLLQADCTVVVCHSRTRDLGSVTRQADILVAAAGRADLVHGDMLKRGSVVIDFGTNEVNGRLVGDVDFESAALVAPAPSRRRSWAVTCCRPRGCSTVFETDSRLGARASRPSPGAP